MIPKDSLTEFQVNPKEFQAKFLFSQDRYPAMVSAWGTGKTMFGILRGVLLSKYTPNNLGLIVRKEFTDLRDSTMKDFERYTGQKIGSDKNIKIWDSEIMFRHGAELDILKKSTVRRTRG